MSIGIISYRTSILEKPNTIKDFSTTFTLEMSVKDSLFSKLRGHLVVGSHAYSVLTFLYGFSWKNFTKLEFENAVEKLYNVRITPKSNPDFLQIIILKLVYDKSS